jgi:hypothetical protein
MYRTVQDYHIITGEQQYQGLVSITGDQPLALVNNRRQLLEDI